jgi:hypothetical protein
MNDEQLDTRERIVRSLEKKEAVRATETYRQFARLDPKNAQGPFLIGVGLRVTEEV